MATQNNKTLYIFIDESGGFDFSPSGSKYFILTCLSTIRPLENRGIFLDLKYKLLKEGFDQEYFHATEDKQVVRDQVFNLIKELNDFEVDSVIAQKNKVNWSLYEKLEAKQKKVGFKFKKKRVEQRLYKQISETLLQYVIRRYLKFRDWKIEKVVVVFGALFFGRKQEFVKKYIKLYFKENFGKVPYTYFHQVRADINCQIADYCSWAIYRKWERGDLRPYNQIKDKKIREFDIFERGETTYYEYKK